MSRERPVDIVVLDINMPEIGGAEACHRIRALASRSGIPATLILLAPIWLGITRAMKPILRF
jgi:CheY-like chemotaxis protein